MAASDWINVGIPGGLAAESHHRGRVASAFIRAVICKVAQYRPRLTLICWRPRRVDTHSGQNVNNPDTMTPAMVDVALFPIPNCVNFPGVPCPLHVFEPRYRQMARYCIDNEMLMGVCHTEKLVHANTRQQDIREALSSNQSTYKPQGIFSAGPVRLLQELDDGRMLIEVGTSIRLRLNEEKQTLPFSIWSCEELLDQPCDAGAEALLLQTQAKILQRLLTITHENAQAQEVLQGEHWQDMSAHDFSFAVAGLLGMDPEISQALLEMTHPQQRLDSVLDMLNEIGPSVRG